VDKPREEEEEEEDKRGPRRLVKRGGKDKERG